MQTKKWNMSILSRAAAALIIGGTLYANIGRAQTPLTQQKEATWQDSSQWLYGALSSNFAKRVDNYQSAIKSIKGIAEASKQYSAFEYSYDLATSAVQNERAASIAREWVAAFPKDNDAHLALIRALLALNQTDDAYLEIKIVLQNDAGPQNVAEIIRQLPFLPDGADRVNLLKRLSNDFPNNPYLYYYLGITAKEQGQIDLVIDAFNHALMLDKHWRQLELLQAKALSDIGELREAKKMMAQLKKRYPDDPSLISTEIDMLVDHYQWTDALKLAQQWRKLNPEDERIQELVAWLYANNGDYQNAETAYQKLFEHGNLDNDQYHFQLAQAAISAKKIDTAQTLLKKIPTKSRMYMMARQQLALISFDIGDLEHAQQQFNELRTTFPEYALEMYIVEINRLDQAGAHPAASALLEQALNTYPQHVDLLYAQAEHLTARNQIPEAETTYQTILKLDPANTDALNAYGYLLLTKTDRHQEATKMINEAIKNYPDSPVIQDSYGWLLYRSGKLKEALSWLQRAYAAYRKDEIPAHYIEILAANGKKELAKEIYHYETIGQPDNPYLKETGKRLELDKAP